jgi:hypothetical protein
MFTELILHLNRTKTTTKMTNVVCMISRRCTTLIATSNICTNNSLYYDQRIRRSYYYRPWWIYTHKQQQIAQFCKKSKKLKDPSTTTNTTTTATAVPSSKNLRRTKKDQRTATTANDAMVLVPISEQSNQRSSGNSESIIPPTNSTTTKSKVKDSTITSSFTSVYVHPLSQIVLQCLQTNCHDWVQSKNLHQNLIVHRDGTFILESCIHNNQTTKNPTCRPMIDHTISKVTEPKQQQLTSTGSFLSSHHTTNINERMNIKIWTTYEASERKHWLCVSIDPELLYHRYLLQDNSLTPWQGYKIQSSIPERIHSCVYELIHTVDIYEQKVK